MKTIAIATLIAATVTLTGCDFKSTDYHVGFCTAGTLNEASKSNPFVGFGLQMMNVESVLSATASTNGLNPTEVMNGYRAFTPGAAYHQSCAVARKAGHSV